ncbi:unnamed protein product, partial [Medioppia subpectinata]
EPCPPNLENLYFTDYKCSSSLYTEHRMRDAHLSFMSGHSSFAAYCLIYLVIYLQLRLRWSTLGFLRPLYQAVLIYIVIYTGFSRISDYKHHWSDVLIGLIQGTVVAILTTAYISDLPYVRSDPQPRWKNCTTGTDSPDSYGTAIATATSPKRNYDSCRVEMDENIILNHFGIKYGRRPRLARVVHQYINACEGGDRLVDQTSGVLFSGDVGHHFQCLSLEIIGVTASDDHLSAQFGQIFGNAFTDTTTGARNDGYFALKVQTIGHFRLVEMFTTSSCLSLLVVVVCVGRLRADTPANCSYEEIRGVWEFSESQRSADRLEKCDGSQPLVNKVRIELQYPNTAVDHNGNKGTWTLIYNQGFEVIVNDRKYFAFSDYKVEGNKVTSICGKTKPGWSHDVLSTGLIIHSLITNTRINYTNTIGTWTLIYNQGFEVIVNDRKYFAFSDYKVEGDKVTSICGKTKPGWSHDVLGHNWACYTGQRQGNNAEKVHYKEVVEEAFSGPFVQRSEAIDEINSAQSLWTAGHYPEFEGKSAYDMYLMSGGPNSRVFNRPSPAPVTADVAAQAKELPENFDWRNVNGVNYVTPVRNQGNCGSCYAFSSVGMIETRLAVQTNNTLKPVLSAQDANSCSFYDQGCQGGFPYLVAGKYGQDFGLTTEENNPYVPPLVTTCKTKANAPRYYTRDYNYVGGYYGACNEELMRLALYRDGPLAVSFKVQSDFRSYKTGIYSHTKVSHEEANGEFNPFYELDHAVLAVGYGVENGHKYWIVKNSWGPTWGDNGYFKISRGNNECGIESIAVEAHPIISIDEVRALEFLMYNRLLFICLQSVGPTAYEKQARILSITNYGIDTWMCPKHPISDERNRESIFLGWILLMSRLVELMDTIFFILRK